MSISVAKTTDAEAIAGIDDSKFLSPAKLRKALNANGNSPIFACRAWVNFNGTGVVAIRSSGNVSSITDNGTGQYAINFNEAMPDDLYSIVGMTGFRDASNNNEISWISIRRLNTAPYSTTACAISTGFTTSNIGSDNHIVNVAIFR